MKHPHICYGMVFAVLLGIEVLIALFVHDSFVRPYFGDVLVMIVLYAFLRTVLPISVWNKLHRHGISAWIPLLFLFATGVEVLQSVHIVELLGLGGSAAASTIMGTSFDWGDLLCYFSGCLVLCGLEIAEKRFFSASK